MNLRLYFLIIASVICVVLTGIVNVVYRIDMVYTHLFYVPIILTGIWYPRYALFFAALLGLVHIVSDYSAVAGFKTGPLLRAVMFMVVAYVTSSLAFRRDRLLSEVMSANRDLHQKNEDLQNALSEIKTLKGILSICSSCKKIRDDQGHWNQMESYIHAHTEAEFSHGLCPECVEKLYPELHKSLKNH